MHQRSLRIPVGNDAHVPDEADRLRPPAALVDDPERLYELVLAQEGIVSAPDTATLLGRVAADIARLTGGDTGLIDVLDGDQLVTCAASGGAARHVGARAGLDDCVAGRAFQQRTALNVVDVELDPRADEEACAAIGARSILCAPLISGDSTLGVLKSGSARVAAFDERDVDLARYLAQLAGVQLALIAALERSAYESRHDEVTGLGNRRAYDERLAKEAERARRYGQRLALVLLEVDHLGTDRGEDGGAEGEEVLRAAVEVLAQLRTTDDCFRIAADEFAVLLPSTPEEGARRVAMRMVEAIDAEGRATASIGVAAWDDHDGKELHAAATAELHAGRRDATTEPLTG